MTAVRIDGKARAAALCEGLLPGIEALYKRGVTPGLTVLVVGEDPASMIYVRNKEKKARALGINGAVIRLRRETSQEEVIARIRSLNSDKNVHGILVQLPLPAHMNEREVVGAIDPRKDVDGFHYENMGRLLAGHPGVLPCTPRGVIALIESTGFRMAGASAVVVGRSNIVGKPMALLLQMHNATVTTCHSYTKELAALTRAADLLVAATGRAGLITGDMIKPGAVVIDVGMNRTQSGLVGDVVYEEAERVAGYLTPVPGGVGPMTIAMLMQNTVEAAQRICVDFS